MPASATKLVTVKRHHLELNNQHSTASISAAARVDLTGSWFGLIRYEVNYGIARARVRQILGSQDFESSQQNDKGGQKK